MSAETAGNCAQYEGFGAQRDCSKGHLLQVDADDVVWGYGLRTPRQIRVCSQVRWFLLVYAEKLPYVAKILSVCVGQNSEWKIHYFFINIQFWNSDILENIA